eukprot:jgi/Chlat1/3931/Chrsp26S04030
MEMARPKSSCYGPVAWCPQRHLELHRAAYRFASQRGGRDDGSNRAVACLKNGKAFAVELPPDDARIYDLLADKEVQGSVTTIFFEFVVPILLLLGFVAYIKYRNDQAPDKEDREKLRKMELEDRKKKKRTYKMTEGVKKPSTTEESTDSSDPMAEMKRFAESTARVREARSLPGEDFGDEEKEGGVEVVTADSEERITFSDVAGIGEAKLELQELVDFFRFPDKFAKSGAIIPRTIAQSPSIVFIDEIDAVARARGSGVSMGGGTEEREQCLNQLLIEMDGFDARSNVIVIGATNRPDLLDKAILRPGRFDRKVNVGLPNYEGRTEILKVHARKKPIASDVDFREIAAATAGMSGAALANLLNTAALLSAREFRQIVTADDIKEAIDLETLGRPRELHLSEERRRLLALREAAQAVTAVATPFHGIARPLDLISIVPREGHPFGQTKLKPNEQLQAVGLFSKAMLLDQIVVLLSGRACEELRYGKEQMSTAGADNLERAKLVAQKMVLLYGMSSSFGPVSLASRMDGNRFLKEKQQAVVLTMSESSLQASASVDAEVQSILDMCYATAKQVMKANRELTDALVNALLSRGVLKHNDIDEILSHYPLQRLDAEAIDIEPATKEATLAAKEIVPTHSQSQTASARP